MKKRLVFGLVSIAVFVGVTATAGLADPNLSNVSPHRHWISTPEGQVQVGPRLCDDPSLQAAFNQFHNNLHVAGGTSIGPAAPGLHNGTGADITASGCG